MLTWVAVGGASISMLRHAFASSSSIPQRRIATLLDITCATDAVELVRRVGTGDATADVLAERLEVIFLAFPPNEITMRRLSLLQQEYQGTGGTEEFAISTVFSVAMTALTNLPPRWPVPREMEESNDVPRSCPSTPDRGDRPEREGRCRAPPARRTPTLPFRPRASPPAFCEPRRVPSVLTGIGRRIPLPLRTRTRHRRARASRSAPP